MSDHHDLLDTSLNTTVSAQTTQTLTPDVVVIGGGSGGLTTAAVMASFGVPVVLIEKHKMGGDCLNVGCVPSKAILAAAKHAHAIMEGPKFGVHAKGSGDKSAGDLPFDVDFERVHDHIHEVIGTIAPVDSVERFEGLGVTVLGGEAHFVDKQTVQVGNTTVKARRIVIATGSRPAVPPIPGLDTVPYITNEVIFDRKELPEHLIIVGAGPIGLELAQAHNRLGSKVTVLEGFKVLGREDREAAELVKTTLEHEGVTIHEHTMVTSVAKDGDGVEVTVSVGEGEAKETQIIKGSHIMVAAGRAVNVEGLDLEKAGIAYDRRGIKVDAGMRTSNKKVFAIGDVAGGLQFTHVAGYHGALIARNILFRLPIKQNATILPKTTYTDPEVASVGATEEELKNTPNIRVLRWAFHENDRAIAERTTDGFIKVFTTKRGKILGAVIVGPKAGEIISLWGLAIAKGMKISDITSWVAAYPTLSEVGRRAAVEYYKGATDNPTLRKIITFLQRFG